MAYFSEFDIYSVQDCLAGLTSFEISSEVLIHWKILIEDLLLKRNELDKQEVNKVMKQFSKQWEIVYLTEEDKKGFMNL